MSLNQLYIFLSFLVTGFVIGILFDIFRILRKSFKNIDWITYIQDILFWVLTAAILLYSIFTFNNGELRGYIFLSIILGIVIYLLTLSKYFILIWVKIFKIIFYPLRVCINFIKKQILLPLCTFFKNVYSKASKKFVHILKTDKIHKKVQ